MLKLLKTMDSLQLNCPDPTFIIDINTQKIFHANDAAVEGCGSTNPIGKLFDDIVYVERNVADSTFPTFFNNLWFNLSQEPLGYENRTFAKLILRKRSTIPDPDLLQTLKKMIGILLHRLRSPLTGMQGYIDLIQENLSSNTEQKRLGMVDDGLTQLFDIFDELESLQQIPLSANGHKAHAANPELILHSILLGYPSEIRKKITFNPQGEVPYFNCSPIILKRILSFLLENAIEHCANTPHSISIDIPSDRSLKISHPGEPIPQSICKELFFPFVTQKTNNLGIGLTMALLYANQHHGSIFLTDNDMDDGISFTLCLPPQNS